MFTKTVLKKGGFAVFLFLTYSSLLFASDGAATRRFGIFIGSNNGGRDRAVLRYAVSDARSVSGVFASMGGISVEDSVFLIEPGIAEINRQLERLGRLSGQAKQNSQRTELVFYYSGHSDEDGILLNRERYSYSALKERINTIQADMRIVILDSCSSGAITRAKGGVKVQPFLFDNSVSTEGYAFLTSSSADETSQESDLIESSYFTHSLLTGLRGAADSVGDGRVTLNELYRYTYTETLAKTEASVFGPQHPSYDIQISGSGDVVMTDIKEISATLLLAEEISGRINVRNNAGFLVAELSKLPNKPIELGLEPGPYRVSLQKENNFYQARVTIPENSRTNLDMKEFSVVAVTKKGLLRRGGPGLEIGYVPENTFNIQLIPGFDLLGHSKEKVTNNFLFGLFAGMGHNIKGLGLSSLGLINTGDVHGAQISGIFNEARDVKGFQAALININEDGYGAMVGIVNISEAENMVPIGLVNVFKNGMLHPAVYYDSMFFINTSFRSGSKSFYTVFSFGLGGESSYSGFNMDGELRMEDTSRMPYLFRGTAGFGFEYPFNDFFFDFDASLGLITVPERKASGQAVYGRYDELAGYSIFLIQLRLTAGYKFYEHLGIFGGISYSIHRLPQNSNMAISEIERGSFNYDAQYKGKLGFFGGIQF